MPRHRAIAHAEQSLSSCSLRLISNYITFSPLRRQCRRCSLLFRSCRDQTCSWTGRQTAGQSSVQDADSCSNPRHVSFIFRVRDVNIDKRNRSCPTMSMPTSSAVLSLLFDEKRTNLSPCSWRFAFIQVSDHDRFVIGENGRSSTRFQ